MRDLISVRTPENVRFEFELAGLASRGLAWAIDVGVMAVLISVVGFTLAVFGYVLAGFAKALYFVALFAIQWGYCAVLECHWQGQTVGKRMVGIRVVSSQGVPIGFGAAALRNLLRVVDILPGIYLVGAASVLRDARARRLGDTAADTVVVRTRRAELPSAIVAPHDRYNSFAHDAKLAHVTRTISAPERDAMLGLAFRRELLPLPVRHALFSKLARHLEQRLAVPRPAYLSEERFVLNLTAVALQRDDYPREGAKRHD